MGDESRPTCTCADGTVITRPKRNPCGDELNPTAYVLMVLPQQESLPARMATSLFVLVAFLLSAMMDLTQTQDPFPHALMDLQGVKTVDQFLVLMELESHLLLQT